MRILVTGADGYLGWPTCMYLAAQGYEVIGIDNYNKRKWEDALGTRPLVERQRFTLRTELFCETLIDGNSRQDICRVHPRITTYEMDVLDLGDVYELFDRERPEAIIHYAEACSAPQSMADPQTAGMVQHNNIVGTLNLLWAMRECTPDAHLVKLGTMGEYGTPDCAIPEGDFTVLYNGDAVTLPFPRQPGSIYHSTKVADWINISMLCKLWGLRATDHNQGVVYGITTDETELHDDLGTHFHYDSTFGTCLNRFCTQAVCGLPITPYGKGKQTRGYLNIRDTLRCVELSCQNPPKPGEARVFNQFAELFSVRELAELVQRVYEERFGGDATITHIENPRVEAEEHYYNPQCDGLKGIGWEPLRLEDTVAESIMREVHKHRDRVDRRKIDPFITWRGGLQREDIPEDWEDLCDRYGDCCARAIVAKRERDGR